MHKGVRQLGDVGEDIGELGLRIDVVEFAGDDEGVHHRGAHAYAVGVAEYLRPPQLLDQQRQGGNLDLRVADLGLGRHHPRLGSGQRRLQRLYLSSGAIHGLHRSVRRGVGFIAHRVVLDTPTRAAAQEQRQPCQNGSVSTSVVGIGRSIDNGRSR